MKRCFPLCMRIYWFCRRITTWNCTCTVIRLQILKFTNRKCKQKEWSVCRTSSFSFLSGCTLHLGHYILKSVLLFHSIYWCKHFNIKMNLRRENDIFMSHSMSTKGSRKRLSYFYEFTCLWDKIKKIFNTKTIKI